MDDAEALSDDVSLGQLLLQRGKLDQAGCERALRWHHENGQRINVIVTSLGLVTESDMAAILAEFLSLPLLTPADYPDDIAFDDPINPDFLKDQRILPLRETADGILLAMADPRDTDSGKAISLKYGKPVLPRVAVPSELEEAIDRLYGSGKSSLAEIVENIDDADIDVEDDAERLKDLASEAPVIRLVNLLISKSVEERASDIHIEPYENRLRVRYRIDGVLNEVESPPSRLRHAIISRVKIMAKLNIAERRLPQDGRIKLVVRGKEVDLRVSTVPTMHGESVVLRILDKSGGVLGLEDLGIDGSNFDNIMEMLHRPNGIILVTGPTGSGKTTTLYASLIALNSPDRKILTVEDPVEYQLYGVTQIQVKPQIGLSFASVLRSFLRQDPDVILIGEIRDLETAQIAVQASLTGHLVLSTLHTNSAAATVTRLLEMGVEDYLLTSTLTGVVAQRLLRTLCPECREPYTVLPAVAKELHLSRMTNKKKIILHRAAGCEKCRGSGYLGRACIAEVLRVDDALKTLIMKHVDARQIHKHAVGAGMQTMYEDGLRKALSGVTSIEEVMRVTREA